MSWEMDRNEIFNRYAISESRPEDAVRTLGEFLSVHHPDREKHEWELLENLKEAVDASKRAIAIPTSPENWNIPRLLEERKNGLGQPYTALRKPKITVNMYVTEKGNLTVRWQPHSDRNDFTLNPYGFDNAQAFHRPMNELFFARGFSRAMSGAGREIHPDAAWRRAIRLRIAKATLSYAESIIKGLETQCDVELDVRVVAELDSETRLITSWDHDNLFNIRHREEATKREREERERANREAAHRSYVQALRDTVDGAEAFYGLPATKLIGLIDAIREHRLSFPDTLDLMHAKFGMKSVDPNFNHVGNTRSIRNAMRELGVEAETHLIAREEVAALLGKTGSVRSPIKNPKPEAAVARAVTKPQVSNIGDGLRDRILARRAGGCQAPQAARWVLDYARLRAYAASPEELEQAGVSSVEELVRNFNESAEAIGRFRVTEADYPNSRKKFDRLLARWRDLESKAGPPNNGM